MTTVTDQETRKLIDNQPVGTYVITAFWVFRKGTGSWYGKSLTGAERAVSPQTLALALASMITNTGIPWSFS